MKYSVRCSDNQDPEFAQFVERHNFVANDPEVRKEFDLWVIEEMLAQEEIRRAEARGVAIGRAECDMEIASNAFESAISEDDYPSIIDTLSKFKIQEETIKIALNKAKANRK